MNYEFWVIITCQCKFIDCNKCTTVAQDIDSGGGSGLCGGRRCMGTLLYFLLRFVINLNCCKKYNLLLKSTQLLLYSIAPASCLVTSGVKQPKPLKYMHLVNIVYAVQPVRSEGRRRRRENKYIWRQKERYLA